MIFKHKILIVFSISLVLVLFGIWVKPHIFSTTTIGEVVKTEVKRHDNNDLYLVYFQIDKDDKVSVLKNEDCFWRFKFNSSDYQANLIPGKRYEITTLGRRWNFPTNYKNIIDYKLIESEKNE